MRTRSYDRDEAADALRAAGWTDGLPVTVPTRERVEHMLDAAAVAPDDVVGGVAELGVALTADIAAANAVMAGCPPDTFPIVLAAIGAALDPGFHLPVVTTSTGGAAIGVLVSGPMAARVGMEGGHNALGGVNHANATIGRAVHLAARNLLGIGSGRVDGTSLGHPARISLCFTDTQPPAPWGSLSESLGYDAGDTTVTVFAADTPRQVANHLSEEPDDILATLASALASPWHYPVGKGGTQAVVVLGPEHAASLVRAGWTRADTGAHLRDHSRVSADQLAAAGQRLEQGSQHDMVPDDDGLFVTIDSPEDVLVATAGGSGAGWSCVIPSWAPTLHSRRATRRVRPPGEGLPPCGPDGCTVEWT